MKKTFLLLSILIICVLFITSCNTNDATLISHPQTDNHEITSPSIESDSVISPSTTTIAISQTPNTPNNDNSNNNTTDEANKPSSAPPSDHSQKPSSGNSQKPPSGSSSKPSGGSTVNTGTGAYNLKAGETVDGGTYTSEADDQSAIRAEGVNATLENVNIVKSAGDASSADASSFYGLNSALHAINSAELTVKNCTITATAKHSTGVFAYNKATIKIYNSVINVTGGGAGGIQVSGGGILYAYDLTVNSASKAAIRSDRGGGTMIVDGGTYTSTGTDGCPAIYSTADITVKNSTLTSTNSRGVIIEGKNSVTLENCVVNGCDQSTNAGTQANVMIYQSMSGDADIGEGSFKMTGGKLVTNSGGMFFITNTSCTIDLQNVELCYNSNRTLITLSGTQRWGTSGKNGGTCIFNATDQKLTGDVEVDSISSIKLNLTSSEFVGAINNANSNGESALTLDSQSTWRLTGDSYLSSFNGNYDSVITNGYRLFVNGIQVK